MPDSTHACLLAWPRALDSKDALYFSQCLFGISVWWLTIPDMMVTTNQEPSRQPGAGESVATTLRDNKPANKITESQDPLRPPSVCPLHENRLRIAAQTRCDRIAAASSTLKQTSHRTGPHQKNAAIHLTSYCIQLLPPPVSLRTGTRR